MFRSQKIINEHQKRDIALVSIIHNPESPRMHLRSFILEMLLNPLNRNLMIDHPLSILIIHSNRQEIDLIKSTIRSFAPDSIFVIAKNETSLKKQINWLDYHMVICDHQLPNDQAQRANMRLRIQMPHLPFILITSCQEMNKGLFSRGSSSWSTRAIIDRTQLPESGQIFQSVLNNSLNTVEQERNYQIRYRKRNLLLQKFECLLRQAQFPVTAFVLEEFSNLLFGHQNLADGVAP